MIVKRISKGRWTASLFRGVLSSDTHSSQKRLDLDGIPKEMRSYFTSKLCSSCDEEFE
jgi:hypothetical protein